ncbi:MAG: preprotein translocase subunit YajC [Tissierellia bacterium]|nr:preprotein translocase subunit YajC [Tissierellia bacterium]
MAAANAGGGNLGGLIVPIAFLVVFYLFAIRPQRKREKQIREMRENLKVGDEIVTIGGIYGKVIKLKDDVVTIEVGASKTRMDVTRWAIGTVTNKQETEDKKED